MVAFILKQLDNKQPKKKRTARLRKIVSIIGGTIGFVMFFFKIRSKRRKEQPIHTDYYIPIGSNINPIGEIAVTKEHFDDASTCVQEKEDIYGQLIQDILHNELFNAKKVWVKDSNQEEMQIENNIYEEDGQFFLGNSGKNTKLKDIYTLKYRNKIYFDRDTINQ